MKVLIKCKDAEYTLPKDNLVPFAQYQALTNNIGTMVTTEGAAVEFLKLMGMTVQFNFEEEENG